SPLPADAPAAVASSGKTSHADLSRQPIELREVSLTYPGRTEPALQAVSATIRPGELVVLTGPSGAGKSSLLALLLRFADPTAGCIDIGGAGLAAIPV